jgi:hypothetical protein
MRPERRPLRDVLRITALQTSRCYDTAGSTHTEVTMTTEKNSPANQENDTTGKPIDLNERDLNQVTGGTGTRGVIEADPCAGGKARAQ